MIDALIAGRIHGQPAKKVGGSGRPFYVAKVRTPTTREGDAIFVSVIAFDAEVGESLVALTDGDSVCLTGELTPKVWTDREGNAKPALDLIAHGLVSTYHVSRKRKAVAEASAGRRTEQAPAATDWTQTPPPGWES